MTRVDLVLLSKELEAASVAVPNGLATLENTLETVRTPDANGQLVALPPEADPVLARHDATKPERTASFEAAEDAERLRIVNERARTDPAFAALAELVLKGATG